MSLTKVPISNGTIDASAVNLALTKGNVFLDLDIGDWKLSGTVVVPHERRFIVVGRGTLTGVAGFPLFNILGSSADPWNGEFRIEGLIISHSGAPAIATANRPHLNKFALRDCELLVSGAYAVDLDIDYSLSPEITNCRFGAMSNGAAIRVHGDVHPASGLTITRVHCHYQNDKLGPCIWLEGCQMTHVQDVIIEGGDGLKGPEGVQFGTQGLLVVNPGYRGSVYENLWFEWWADSSGPTLLNSLSITNTFQGSAGAYAPGPQAVRNISGARTLFSTVDNTYDHLPVYLSHCGQDTLSQLTTAGKTSVVVDEGMTYPLSPSPPSTLVVPDPKVYIRSAVQTDVNFRRSAILDGAQARPIYEYRGGSGLYSPSHTMGTNGRGSVFCHRHPTHGPCLAIMGVPDIHLPDLVRSGIFPSAVAERLFARVRIAAPYNTVTGNGTSCPVYLSAGPLSEALWVPDGFVPTDHAFTDIAVNTGACLGITSAPYVGMGGGPRPGNMWLLVYSATLAGGGYAAPTHSPQDPVICYESLMDAGPPIGTWQAGDMVWGKRGTTYSVCTISGTTRPLSFSAAGQAGSTILTVTITNTTGLLEGEWITAQNWTPARILKIDGNKVMIDRPAPTTGIFAFRNYVPSWLKK